MALTPRTYAYHANSRLVNTIIFKQSGDTQMTTTKTYDFINRLTQISSTPGSGPAISFGYAYNLANQRTNATLADASSWRYGYDSLGQVTSGKKYWSDGSIVAGQQFEYGFDTIGNREFAKTGGNSSGGNLRTSSYTPNALNQYDQRTVYGSLNVLGAATNTATVTVNGQSTECKGEYFRGEIGVDNSGGLVYQALTNLALLSQGTNLPIGTNVIGHLFLPKTPEVYVHDNDGNLTSDGRWTYAWDAENRLIQMTAHTNLPGAARFKLDFTYDYGSRRTSKKVYAWSGSDYVSESSTKFVYDGWNLITETHASGALLRSYIWGTDVSGTLQGAGGVGGLLALTSGTNDIHFFAFDGNGNVAGLVGASSGTQTAAYEYGPFGEVIRATGPMAKANPFRFSTKYQDDETDFLYYGFRYYNPPLGRWLSRDPIGEWDGPNIYAFVHNAPVNLLDRNGLESWGNYFDVNGNWAYPHGLPKPPNLPPASFLPVSGDFTFTVTDAANHTAIGSIVVGVEMTRTGELRLQYDRLAQELKRLGLSDEAAKAARTALQEEFRKKGPALFQAWTQKILEERARTGHQNPKSNPFKTNAKLNAQAKVLSGAGRAVAVLGFAVEAYNLYQTPADALPSEAAKAGGRLGGGFAGGAAAGAIAGTAGAGPVGTVAGVIIGGIAGSIAGEGVVEACIEKK